MNAPKVGGTSSASPHLSPTIPAPTVQAATRYIVLYRGWPVRFVHNVSGRVWSLVKNSEATQFESEAAADGKLRAWGLISARDYFTIAPYLGTPSVKSVPSVASSK